MSPHTPEDQLKKIRKSKCCLGCTEAKTLLLVGLSVVTLAVEDSMKRLLRKLKTNKQTWDYLLINNPTSGVYSGSVKARACKDIPMSSHQLCSQKPKRDRNAQMSLYRWDGGKDRLIYTQQTIQETERRMLVTGWGVGGGGEGRLLFSGYREFQICKMKEFWRFVSQ